MNRRTLILAAAGALAITAGGAAAYLRFGRAVPVATIQAGPGSVALRVTGPGTMQARMPVTISSRITASVRQVDADVGESVERGQLLALLGDRDLAARRGVAAREGAARLPRDRPPRRLAAGEPLRRRAAARRDRPRPMTIA